jgi:hypothetical protein
MTEKNNNLKKGGKKGGTQFPKYSLKHLFPLLKTLVSKTHSTTINIEQLSAGVFGIGAKSDTGKIKSSALKQFGLIEGDYAKFSATELAAQISILDGDEQLNCLQQAFNNVKVFNNSYNTFQDSKTEKSKIAQYAVSTLKIHPDLKEDFLKVLLESAEIAGFCKIDGNIVLFEKSNYNFIPIDTEINNEDVNQDNDDNGGSDQKPTTDQKFTNSTKQGLISNINVSIDINSSMDPEKLERLLKLLKGYGAI